MPAELGFVCNHELRIPRSSYATLARDAIVTPPTFHCWELLSLSRYGDQGRVIYHREESREPGEFFESRRSMG